MLGESVSEKLSVYILYIVDTVSEFAHMVIGDKHSESNITEDDAKDHMIEIQENVRRRNISANARQDDMIEGMCDVEI